VAVVGQLHASLRERIIGEQGVFMLIGGPDTGKTTLSKFLLADALTAGLSAAFVDADLDATTVGPPACVGLKWITGPESFDTLAEADELRFVGSTQPDGVVLSHVVAATSLVELARSRADVVVLDTTGVVSGIVGQTLKYHLAELSSPALVIAMQRGGEMEPVVGMLQRFLGVRVARGRPHEGLPLLGPLEQRNRRIASFRDALEPPLPRWRIEPTVFAPTLPEAFDLERLEGMLVGVQDGEGRCLGLGVLEFADGALRVATHHGEQMKGLRLGSLTVSLATMETTRVRLRQLIFGV
jgi:polynucleotide 5'-kinase involved in rRNA processing